MSVSALSIFMLLYFGFTSLNVDAEKQQQNDGFDDIRNRMNKVNADNCAIQNAHDLYLPEDAISHLISTPDLMYTSIFPNRSALLQLHNMALGRSFFWSYIFQNNFPKPEIEKDHTLYYFLATVSDVLANPSINASAIYFAPDNGLNETVPLFAPRTIQLDKNTFHSRDQGALLTGSSVDNYTSESYKINEWYRLWLPDNTSVKPNLYEKTTYQVTIRYADDRNVTSVFFGPPGADDTPGPVKFTRPYFDCGRSNKWLVAAVVPITGLRLGDTLSNNVDYPKYIAVSVLEMEYDKIDINQCPVGKENTGPNRFADTGRCKKETTECEPLHGFGLRRGGYQCRCKPGYRRPWREETPYFGEELEGASDEVYNNGFDCLKIESPQDLPVNFDEATTKQQEEYLNEYSEYRNPKTDVASLREEKLNVAAVMNFIYSVRPSNCHIHNALDLDLPIGYTYGATEFFENEARTGLRLANFISAFLQISDPNELLTEDEMFGEAIALISSNHRVWSAGIYWEPNAFNNRTLFAPFAYKESYNVRKFKVEDVARLNESDRIYTEKPWYRQLKERWSTNDLEQFQLNMKIRDTKNEDFSYVGTNLKLGYWTSMYYNCDGPVNRWLITYAAPFFGWGGEQHVNLEFKGVVAVSMDALHLDINQCDSDSIPGNAFNGTHKCDRQTTHCVPILGRQFSKGGYKCECLQGYEYPFNELITYFDGELIEAEFESLIRNEPTRYDIQKCRLAGSGSHIPPNITLFHIHAANEADD